MKPAAWVLLVIGILALGAGVWASLILPANTIENAISIDGRRIVSTLTRTLWGRNLSESLHVTYENDAAKPHGEGIGDVPDEYILSGPLDGTGARHGRWTSRERNGPSWSETEIWYWRNEKTTREEWVRR